MHPSIHFFERSKKEVSELKKKLGDKREREFQVRGWGLIDMRRYYIMRDSEEGVSEFFILFNTDEFICVNLAVTSNLFKFDSDYYLSVEEKYVEPMLTILTEFIIVEAAIQNIHMIHGYFYEYEYEWDIYSLILAVFEILRFTITDLNPGFKAGKLLKTASSPIEKAFLKSGIKGLNPEKIHHGRLPDKKYYFTAVLVQGDIYRYELRSGGCRIAVEMQTDSSEEEKWIKIEVCFLQTDKHALFHQLLENISYDCIHNYIPGDIKGLICFIDNSMIELIEPGFKMFKATQIDRGKSQLFILAL
jgi:hypothetical protein